MRFGRPYAVLLLLPLIFQHLSAQQPTAIVVLKSAHLFDGETTHDNWAVRVKADRIEAVVTLKVKDYLENGCPVLIRLHKKGGKEKDIPCHHLLEA